MIRLNDKFLTNMQQLLGGEFEDFLKAMDNPEQKAIYVNKNKISLKDFASIADFKLEKIPYEDGFYVNEKLGKHPLHHAGAFYVQDASAMFTINSIKFNGNEAVLDMCAAPGGKTIQIANRLPEGVLVSNEIEKNRAKVLYSNVERMGLRNVIISNDTPENIAKAYANSFDVCLVDAPCSGEGMFRRGEEYVATWNENLPLMNAQRQLQILNEADKCLKEGGKIIYSTCTYSKLENEGVISEFLKAHKYRLVNISAPFNRGIGIPEAVRIYPHKNKGEGQFVAVLVKLAANDLCPNPNLRLKEDFSCQNTIKELNLTAKLYEYNNSVFCVPNLDFVKKGVNYITLGVNMGEKVGKIFKPNHFLFSAFGNFFHKYIDLPYNSEEAKKYLHGEQIEVHETDGYGVVKFNGCAVGGFKISAGAFKNLYPKGLRN